MFCCEMVCKGSGAQGLIHACEYRYRKPFAAGLTCCILHKKSSGGNYSCLLVRSLDLRFTDLIRLPCRDITGSQK